MPFLSFFRRKSTLIAGGILVIGSLAVLWAYYFTGGRSTHTVQLPPEPEAPPDLQKLRAPFASGVEAVIRSDGEDAVRHLTSFTFGSRAVEEYRLFYLASGYALSGKREAARLTLTRLWQRNPQMIHATEAGFNLAALHSAAGSNAQAMRVASENARRSDVPVAAATARWQELEAALAVGDVATVVSSARLIFTRSPRAPQANDAIAVVRSVTGLADNQSVPLTPGERLERAVSLLRDGDPQHAYEELTALQAGAPQPLALPIQLNRGLALHQLRRFEDSNRVLEPLTSSYYKYAIPALYHLVKNYRILAASIDPTITKTVIERKQVGATKVRVGKGKKARAVAKPKFANVKRNVKLVDLVKKQRREFYESLSLERLKDLLQLSLSDPVRIEVLNTLISIAEGKNLDEYEQQLIDQLIKLDRLADPGLQHFWDKAWGAYTRGDASAAPLFRFISDTYKNPNVRRQSEYWFARTIEKQGRKEEATAIYQRLANAPYADLYAQHSISHGAKREEPRVNPLQARAVDWREIAEKEMPGELRLAYELTALSDYRDARVEIQKNVRRENQRFADALLADLYNSTGNPDLMYRAIRRAFPELATVEQDSVPSYFLSLYYPIKYVDAIKKYSVRQGLDPYLVMGLILQESYFNPEARSRVGATGLMQLMPPTAKEIAGRLHVPFGATRLQNPEVNIQLGTYHLRMLVNMFGGNTYLAVASYNAGQGNILKWRRAAPGKPLDEFLESIPFPETRNYVKRVTLLRTSYSRMVQ